MTTTAHRRPTAGGPRRRIWILVGMLALVAAAATTPLRHSSVDASDIGLGLVLVVGVTVTERWSLNARIGHVSQRLTLSEVPLLIGLFHGPGVVLLAARLLGGTLALQVLRKQEPHKTAYNLVYLWIETLALLAFFDLVRPESVADGGEATVMALGVAGIVAVMGALAGTGAVSVTRGALTLHHFPRAVRDAFPPSLATAAATTIGLILAAVDPVLLWAPAVVLAVLLMAYRSHVGLLEAQRLQVQLSRITNRITGDTSVDETVQRLVEAARTLMDAPQAAIRLVDDSGRTTWHGAPPTLQSRFEHRVSVLDGTHGPAGACCDDELPAVAAPIEAIPGAWLAVGFNERHQVARSDARAAEMLANHASVAITNARRGAELVERAVEANHLAHHDALTGLPNRNALMSMITEAIEEASPFGLLLVDLDNFKEINDALGHAAGDSVLVAIAQRCAGLHDDVVLGRLGGDEFLAVVRGDEAASRQVAETLRRVMSQPVVVGPYTLEVNSSVGISLHPRDGVSVGDLLKQADLAMYEAKTRGSGVEVFGEAAAGHAMRQLAISSGFRAALGRDEIDVVFQPLVDLDTGTPVAVEALARWTDPVLGAVSPEEFVRVAEQSGLTADLTERVLNRSLSWLRAWSGAGLDLRLSVNLSVRTLVHAGLTRLVSDALQRHDIRPDQLTLEITETAVLTDPQRTLPVLERLAALGVTLAIDDFGTGYSSLAYLRQLPAREVKIDKSFIIPMVDDPGAGSLVGGIVRLCHEMGFAVVGEGVENEQVRVQLADLGCDLGQGFGIARPMAPEAVEGWVRDHSPLSAGVAAGTYADPWRCAEGRITPPVVAAHPLG